MQTAKQLIGRIASSWDPTYEALIEAQKRAQESRYFAYSDDAMTRIIMDGSFRTHTFEINPEVYDEVSEDELEDAILSAYKNSRDTVQRNLINAIMPQAQGVDEA